MVAAADAHRYRRVRAVVRGRVALARKRDTGGGHEKNEGQEQSVHGAAIYHRLRVEWRPMAPLIHPFCYVALGIMLGQLIRWGYWEIRYRLTLRKANRMLAERLGPPR